MLTVLIASLIGRTVPLKPSSMLLETTEAVDGLRFPKQFCGSGGSNLLRRSTASVVSNNIEDGFNGTVLPMREAIRTVNMDYVKKLDGHLNFIAENIEKSSRGEVVTFGFTSLCRFPIYEANFGWGKPVWVGSTKLLYHNFVTFFDTKSEDGIEAWITLKEEDMAKFEMDKEVLPYVSFAKNSVF